MLQKIYTAEELAERYSVSPCTARRYIRDMKHMEKPLRAFESAVLEWERRRTVESQTVILEQLAMEKAKKARKRA